MRGFTVVLVVLIVAVVCLQDADGGRLSAVEKRARAALARRRRSAASRRRARKSRLSKKKGKKRPSKKRAKPAKKGKKEKKKTSKRPSKIRGGRVSCSAGRRIPFRKRGKPILIQYDVQASIKKIVAGLPLDGRLFVQEPNAGHLHGGDADIPFRLGRVNEEALAVSGGVDAMVAALKGPLDANLQGVCGINGMSNIQCKSGIITVDEINFRFHDGTKHAAQLSCAMRKLAAMPYPLGGSYASRIHFFISPSMTREIGVPRKWKRTYKKVQQALKLAGGVWMEMYGSRPHDTGDWFTIPTQWAKYLGGTKNLYAIIRGGMPKKRGSHKLPKVCKNKRFPITCQFAMLASTRAGRAVIRNGVGQYRVHPYSAEYARLIRRLYFKRG